VGWVLWFAGIRTNRLGEISRTIRDAGDRVTGPAKAAWLESRKGEVVALRRPIIEAAQQVSQLADLAEDVVFAAELVREAGLGPGELYSTLGLDLPQPFDIAGSDAIEEATDTLRAWHRTWVELDEGLRAAAEAVGGAISSLASAVSRPPWPPVAAGARAAISQLDEGQHLAKSGKCRRALGPATSEAALDFGATAAPGNHRGPPSRSVCRSTRNEPSSWAPPGGVPSPLLSGRSRCAMITLWPMRRP
jgi:hypothetical protein